jgi:hypothetical protein
MIPSNRAVRVAFPGGDQKRQEQIVRISVIVVCLTTCGLLVACDPYSPGQRAVGGGAIGAGTGAAVGAIAGGGRGAGTGALIGGGLGAVGGALTTPSRPYQPSNGYGSSPYGNGSPTYGYGGPSYDNGPGSYNSRY